MTDRARIEQHGRLTSGNAPLHERRAPIAHELRDCVHTIETMLANWPREYELGDDGDVIGMLYLMSELAENLETP